MASVFITGAGSGFAKGAAIALAKGGHHVIAGVEIPAQISGLLEDAEEQNVKLAVEKIDITDHDDRERALAFDVEVLINNAGISEGGSVLDIPLENIRKQFEVNVFGTIALTQGFARKMVRDKDGLIIFLSSVAGLITDPFTGAYSASKHALEAFAEALYKEVKEFGVQVATLNPGPYLTGFNDRMFETWKEWALPKDQHIFDYEKIAFPHEQYDPKEIVQAIVDLAEGKNRNYRTLLPAASEGHAKEEQGEKWDRKQNIAPGERHPLVEKAFELKPGTVVSE